MMVVESPLAGWSGSVDTMKDGLEANPSLIAMTLLPALIMPL